MALEDEKFKGVLKHKSDLSNHEDGLKQKLEEFVEFDPLLDIEHFQLVGGERQESWSSYGGSDCKKQSSDFFLQPINSSPSLHSYDWACQFKVSVENEVRALSRFDQTHGLIKKLHWKAQIDER